MSVTNPEVVVVEGGVMVAASAEVYDLARKGVYVWSVQVDDLWSGQPLWVHHYVEAAAPLPEGSPAFVFPFRDALPLGPGDYRLTLSLCVVPSDRRPDQVAPGRGVRMRNLGMASGGVRVTVPGP